MKTKKLLVFVSVIFLSCTGKVKNDIVEKSSYKDSTLTLFDFQKGEGFNGFNSENAKSVLDGHFKKKGYLIESELDFEKYLTENPANYGKKAIGFLRVKSINKYAALIEYYNCEPFINGACVRPHYAIAANTKTGNKIVHEEFLSSDFVIDSIINEKNESFIYGYFFECANKIKLQSYRMRLE